MNGRYYSYLNTAVILLSQYDASLPFHHFIRQFFREHPKHGSRDRKSIASLCYACFRTGSLFQEYDLPTRILLSVFLVQEKQEQIISLLRPEWPDLSSAQLHERLDFLRSMGISVDLSRLFPLADRLSPSVRESFITSHIQQPRLFLRIRPGYEDIVSEKLFRAGILFNRSGTRVELANGTDVSQVLEIDKEVVIQDMNAQRTGELMQRALAASPVNPLVWDACAASGGKSILLHDISPDTSLIVSDVRSSILENLKKRFAAAGISDYQLFRADLENQTPNMPPVDILLADVPCSGSGTWGRTPEYLQNFTGKDLDRFVRLQQRILQHALPVLKPGGHLIYMTCSVYAAENEEQVAFIQQLGFRLQLSGLFEGWQNQADSLYGAWLTKNIT